MSEAFRAELAALLNRHSMENGSNTPDFLLTDYLFGCIQAWNQSVLARDRWYGVRLAPGWNTPREEGAEAVYPAEEPGT